MKIASPFLWAIGLILFSGVMLSLSFYFYSDPGDPNTIPRIKLTLIFSFLSSAFILLAATNRWW